jgi:hypothetical protein
VLLVDLTLGESVYIDAPAGRIVVTLTDVVRVLGLSRLHVELPKSWRMEPHYDLVMKHGESFEIATPSGPLQLIAGRVQPDHLAAKVGLGAPRHWPILRSELTAGRHVRGSSYRPIRLVGREES